MRTKRTGSTSAPSRGCRSTASTCTCRCARRPTSRPTGSACRSACRASCRSHRRRSARSRAARREADVFDWVTPELLAIIWAMFKSVVLLIGLVVAGAQMIWLERRMLGLWQDRYGPNRVGWFGLLQVPADMVKIFFKEDWVPPFADKFTFVLAPAL